MLRHLVPLALAAALGSGMTCTKESSGSQPPPDGMRTADHGGSGPAVNETQCVDAWLQKNGLDQYGNKAGTMYMGGTPLFDETTGKTTDRLEYIYQHHPDVKAECHKEIKGT